MRAAATSAARVWGFLALAVLVTAAGATAVSTKAAIAAPASADGPAAMPDRPDLEARDLFRVGRYPEALAIYQRLYAETHHPTYLRNIGRCHQMMREPEPAIESFRAYVRDAHNIDGAERVEIEGYIAEMQRLEVAAPGGAAASTSSVLAGASTPSRSDAITHKWWFWTGIGALAIAGTIAIVAASGGQSRLPCPGGAVCR
jgi:tetratricopeptide (TPR) repeat protein